MDVNRKVKGKVLAKKEKKTKEIETISGCERRFAIIKILVIHNVLCHKISSHVLILD